MAQAPPARRRLIRLGQLLVTGALFAWLVARIDHATILALRAVPAVTLTLALLIFSLSQFCGALRLRILLAAASHTARPPPLGFLLRLTFAAFFASNFLPGTAGGDLFKALALVRQGTALGDTVSAMFVDRLANLAVAAILCGAALTLGAPELLAHLGFRLDVILPVSGGAGLVLICAVIALQRNRTVRNWIARIGARAAVWLRVPGTLASALALSVLGIGSSILAQWLFCAPLGIDLGIVALAAVICLVSLVALVPISLNGIGLQEASIVVLLTGLGVSSAAAVSFALLSRLLVIGASVPGAILAASDRKLLGRAPARPSQA
ncbi:MAG TPA: lysylphosphatidylglycerol synthase transmembrane domain-containing protein [Stellaceae bacterium]|nr:lysylphosphatidylglycerol synthase transmembrane domain-containing protein [Stellaceae bacterium]